MLWTSTFACRRKATPIGTDQLALRVRVGWITRIETVNLYEGWYLWPGQARGTAARLPQLGAATFR